MFGWVDVQHAASQHGEGPAVGVECCTVCSRIDAACQSTDNRQPGLCESGGQSLGLPQAIVSGMPRADDGDCQLIAWLRVAAPEEQSWWVGNFP